MHPITVYSFGYLHPWPEGVAKPGKEDKVYDLRSLKDPARMPSEHLIDKTGFDPEVHTFVLATKGAQYLLDDVVQEAISLSSDGPAVVAFGCAGGRHRSVVFAKTLGEILRSVGIDATVHHLHVHLPRVIRQET